MPDPEEVAFRFALTPNLGVRSVGKLRTQFRTLCEAYEAADEGWEAAGVQPRLKHLARSRQVAESVWRVRKRCEEFGIRTLALDTREYPANLAQIFDPPPVLFVRGRLPSDLQLQRSAGIVGTRKPSDHGLAFTYRLAGELSTAGVVVASGLAMGIDAEAHRAVVDRAGIGIGVLAGGLDRVHPPANRRLAERLCERGCLVSEHPPGVSPRPAFFVGRNRLISGLSRAVGIVEAGARSGAILTATFALEQSRSVFVMPGRPGDPRVEGSLQLLRDGGTVLISAEDFAAELRLGVLGAASGPIAELGDDGSLFSAGVSFDALMAASGLTAPKLLALLSRLEMDGRIRRGSDGFYYRL